MALASGFKVNTNTTSLQTYRSYSKSQAGLEQNIERLSSGLRINRAADDTAGQAISQRMKNQSTGMRCETYSILLTICKRPKAA